MRRSRSATGCPTRSTRSEKGSFIYSLNRLNVAVTRAKAKTVVFLPRPLVEPPIQAYEDDRIAEGVAFMQGLVRFAQRHGEEQRFSLEEGAALLVYRVNG